MQKLIKVAPKGTPKKVIEPMNDLAQYVANIICTKDEYAAIFEVVGSMVNAVSA